MTDADPTMSDRERLAQAMREHERNTGREVHTIAYHRYAADALLDAGFGDVTALRAEVETQGLPEGASLADLIRHHRGSAGLAAAFESMAEIARLTKRAERAEARIADVLGQGVNDDDHLIYGEVHAALTDEQPAPEPKSAHDEGCRDFYSEYGEPEGGLCHVCGEETAPEPPHLDPYAYTHPNGGRIPNRYRNPVDTFAPRSVDDKGRPYSQRREDYEGADRG